jgi:ABC-type lipoprotein release transport system permease subunit
VVAAGVLAGVAVSAALSKTLQPLVFDGPSLDAGSYLGTIVAFLVVAALAALVPCRRALAVDPVVTLKAE